MNEFSFERTMTDFWHLDTNKMRLIISRINSFLVFPGPFHSRFIGKLGDVTILHNERYHIGADVFYLGPLMCA
jgi:hypothetical protein